MNRLQYHPSIKQFHFLDEIPLIILQQQFQQANSVSELPFLTCDCVYFALSVFGSKIHVLQ
jgi:hypothetical protein